MIDKEEYKVESKQTKKGEVTKVFAVLGYAPGVEVLAKVVDNGNGYTVKFPSYSSCFPDKWMNIDYCEAEYLFLAFEHIFNKGESDD